MATINLCVPDELHLRMDDATGESWFAITEQGLESHPGRLAASASASGRTSAGAYGQRGSHTSEEASAASATTVDEMWEAFVDGACRLRGWRAPVARRRGPVTLEAAGWGQVRHHASFGGSCDSRPNPFQCPLEMSAAAPILWRRQPTLKEVPAMFGRVLGSFDTNFVDEFMRLEGELDRLFGRGASSAGIRSMRRGAFPPINVGSTADRVDVYVFAAGVEPKSLDISIQQNLLVVSGERRVPVNAEADYYRRERFVGDFRRVITLPEDVNPDRVDAKYREGVLQITVQRREAARPRQITVN